MSIDGRRPTPAPAAGDDLGCCRTAAPPGTGRAGIVELTVHGRWSPPLGVDVCDAIRDSFAGRPMAIIVDLHGLDDPDGASMTLWLAARRAAAVQLSPVRLALCLPTATTLHRRLRRLGMQHLPLFATVPQARSALTGPGCGHRQGHPIRASESPRRRGLAGEHRI